jgi:hypothetical protein
MLYFNLATFYDKGCTKPGKITVVYLCVRGIKYASIYYFSSGFLELFRHCGIFFLSYHFISIWINEWLIFANPKVASISPVIMTRTSLQVNYAGIKNKDRYVYGTIERNLDYHRKSKD